MLCMYQGVTAPAEPLKQKQAEGITFNSTLSIGCLHMSLSAFSVSIFKVSILIC